MNLFMKQNHKENRLVGVRGKRDGRGLNSDFFISKFCIIYTYMQTGIYIMDRKQALTI